MAKDQKNAYTCDRCHQNIITIDRDDGVTPFMLACRATAGCTGTMRSQFYFQNERTLSPPQYEWRKPTRQEYANMSPAMRQHIDIGGLDIYPVTSNL